jgi:hypothetical protein
MSEYTDGELILRGTSRGVKESRNDRGQVVSHATQVLKRNAKNGIEVLLARLPEGADPANYAEGKPVELVVDISTYEGTLYYRATREILPAKSTDGRGADVARPTAAAVKA